jgi:DNA-binding transcriptional LysR family regulator
MLLRVTLACQGVGIAYLPAPVGDYEPNLIRLTDPVPVAEAWLLYHTDLRYTSRVRAVRDFLQESLIKQFEG